MPPLRDGALSSGYRPAPTNLGILKVSTIRYSISGKNAEVLAALEGYRGQNDTFDLGLDELRAVTRSLRQMGIAREDALRLISEFWEETSCENT